MIEDFLKQPYALLLLAVLMLGIGPLLYRWFDRVRSAKAALDGFVLVGIGGFVLIHVMPEAVTKAGVWAILVALLGVVAPLLFGRLQRFTEEQAHTAAMWLAMVGLLIHGLLDGMALHLPAKGAGNGTSTALALAVLLHRLPVSLMVWNWGRPIVGRKRVIGILFALAGVTVVGFFLGAQTMQAPEGGFWYALFQALVAGALMHVLLHRHDDDTCHTSPGQWRWAEMGGALVGVAVLLVFPEAVGSGAHAAHAAHAHAHAHGAVGYGHRFLELALTSAPALLLGYLLAGALSSFLPQAPLRWLHRGSSLSQASRGMMFGLPLPICSCGVVPVYQSLIQRGVPATAAMAFLVATPELGVESIILSFPLLGVKLTMVRLLSAAILALAVGWLVGRLIKVEAPPAPTDDSATEEKPPLLTRLRGAVQTGLGEVVGDTAAWILVGLAIAALLQPAAIKPLLHYLPAGTDVLLFATLGIPFYVCASGATPLAAALVFSGVSPGAAIAFLLAGPATNVTTFGVLSQLHGLRAAGLFGLAMLIGAMGLGFGANLVLGSYQVPYAKAIHQHQHGDPLQWFSLIALSTAFLVTILRQGPIAFVWSIFASGRTPHEHSHGHDHDHGHDHGHDHDHGDDHDHGHSGDDDNGGDDSGGDDSGDAAGGGSCCSAKIK